MWWRTNVIVCELMGVHGSIAHVYTDASKANGGEDRLNVRLQHEGVHAHWPALTLRVQSTGTGTGAGR